MANNVNGKPGLSANLLPSFYQTPANKKFLQSTIDQLFQPGSLTKLKGYVGRENAKASNGNDIYTASADQNRQNYQLEPGLVIKDSLNNITFFKDYMDYINQIDVFGGNTANHARLNKQEFYSWDPHINWDMFVNFQNYYWLPYGPETITIYGYQDIANTTYSVEVQSEGPNNQYILTPDGATPNPTIKLYKGKTYTFKINSPGNPFSFKTSRSIGTTNRYAYLNAIDNYGVESGTIIFTVPDTAPKILYFQSETDINLGGTIEIHSVVDNTHIDVTKEILGKTSLILKDGTALSNGMKVAFGGKVVPESYSSGQYYVEGVGTAIVLVPVSVLEIISPWSTAQSIPFDTTAFDKQPWDNAVGYAGETDYITINRASRDHNPWSRYNRWFHKDVISKSASYNNSFISLDQTNRAVRPIIEFNADIRLFNFGTTAIMDIDVFDDATGNTLLNPNAPSVFSAIEGKAGYNQPTLDVNKVLPLTEGMLVLFAGDPDPLVQNKIYRVEYVDVKHLNPTRDLPAGSRQLHLVEVATPMIDQVVLVKQGKYQSQMFWYNGTKWLQAQQKIKVNQPPLFDIFDDNGISLSNLGTYSGSTFKGTTLFSYKQGAGTADAQLGFPLSYQNVNNIGDIVFNFDLVTDTFEYKQNLKLQTKNIDTGYLSLLTYAGSTAYLNGWQLCTTPDVQAAIRIYKNSGLTNSFKLDIFDDSSKLLDLSVKVYINGIRLPSSKWNIVDSKPYKIIKLISAISQTDVLTIRAFSSQPINSNGYYEIPLNLQNNPLNNTMSSFTLGEVIDHVSSIVDNIPGFIGMFPGNSELRDLGNITQYGTKFVQHSGPLSLGIYHVASESNNIIKAVQQSRDDYNNFKRLFISTASKLGVDGDPVTLVNLILQKINANKPNTAPYYFSDMVPYGACIVTNLTVVDSRIRQYPLSAVFTLDTLSNKAVGLYLNGVQLTHGRDYNFDNQGNAIIVTSVNLNNGDTISTYEYDSTDGSFVPATPTKLGMWPAYIPQIYLDTTLINPQTVIQGHDGSIMLAYGDYRDALLLELENRIFNNIKVKYDTDIFDISDIVPSYNRANDYSRDEFNTVLAPNFYKWTNLIGKDLTTPLSYDRTNSFTFNYSKNTAPDGTSRLPAYWRGIYRYLLDTDRPNICPWEMLGFSVMPSWWTEVYGPAPYTSNNLPLWQDLSAGALRIPNQPVTYNKKYAKPFLLDHIPVDESGNLVSPQLSRIAGGTIHPSIDNNFVFGDGSPVENAWTRSSYYPFSVLITNILLSPAKVFGLLLDRSRVKRNLAGQLIYTSTGLRLRPSDIALPSVYASTSRIQTAGLVNYIADLIFNYIFSNNLISYDAYATDLKKINTQLSYRIGAFTNKSQFNFLLESKTPTSTGNVFIPVDDYDIFLNKSSSVKKLTYSGVIITKLSTGFEIKGYSITQPYFNYYLPTTSVGTSVNVGGISENYSVWTPGNHYVLGLVVLHNAIYYRTVVTHSSTDTFNNSYFSQLAGLPMTGGVSAKFKTAWNRSNFNVAPYGTLFLKIQDVVDFLLGYGEYLKDQGFLFDDFNKNLSSVANWETSTKEFLFWTTQNWSTGQDKWNDWSPNQSYTYGSIVRYEADYYSALFNISTATVFDYAKWSLLPGLSNVGSSVISLSPSANGINFVTNLAVVDSISGGFHPYEIFKVDGTPFELAHIDSYRQENTVTYSPRTTDGIYGASFYLVQNEHVVVINNTTVFNDIIYSPTSGYRQERLKISGYVTINWYGGLDIPGFIFDAAAVQSWQAYQDYHVADIVNHQGYYYSANKFLAGAPVFTATDWNLLPKKPTSQILPNWTNIATQFTDFYGLEVDSFNNKQQSIAHHLIGYQKRQYLDNIIQDDVSEFKFYQGMIREKGTQNVLNKLFDVLSSDALESLTFYEEWALRVAQYGASNAFENIEFVLDQAKYSRNKSQSTLLINKTDATVSPFVIQQIPNDIYLKPLGYKSDPFPLQDNLMPVLRSAGYVSLLDVKIAIKDLSFLLNQPATLIETGISYKILTTDSTDYTQLGATSNTPGQTFTASSPGYGNGTVAIDAQQFEEGDYIWCSFDDKVASNSWNVYRFTDIKIRATDVIYNNNILTITCKNLIKNIFVGDYVGIVLDYPSIKGLTNFYKVTSIKLNSFTVNATITGFITPFQYSEELIVFALLTSRATSIDDIDRILLANPKTQNVIWTDDRGDGNWASWVYDPVYMQSTASVRDPSLNYQYGKTIALNRIGTRAAVGSATGQVVIYNKIGKTSAWPYRQTIPAPYIASADVNNLNTIATVLAFSSDSKWLAIGSPYAGHAATRYLGEFNDGISYNEGDIVSYLETYYQALLNVSLNKIPNAATPYWKIIFYIPVDSLAVNSGLNAQGVVSLYVQDANSNYNLVDTIISPYPAANENFGSSLAFDSTNLYIGATGANNAAGRVYKLNYIEITQASTFYDDVGSADTTVHVTSTAGILSGQSIQGTGFTSGQTVKYVLTRLSFAAVPGNPNYIKDVANNLVNLSFITPGTIVSGNNIPIDTVVIKSGRDISGKTYVLVGAEKDLTQSISTIQFANTVVTASFVVANLTSDATLVLSAGPESQPNGLLTFVDTSWAYNLLSTLSGEDGHNYFGSTLSLSNDGKTLLVSATGGEIGAVYIYKDLGHGFYLNNKLLGSYNQFGKSTTVSDNGKFIATTDILSYDETDIARHGTVSVYSLTTDNDYIKFQDIVDHFADTGSNFGDTISFMNDSDTLVIYSENAAGPQTTSFDKTTTTFDKSSTNFITSVIGSGRIDVYDRYNTKWVFSETISNPDENFDGFGSGFAVGTNSIFAGAPLATVKDQSDAGIVYIFNKPSDVFSWKQTRTQSPVADISKLKKSFLYNKKTNQLITYLDVIDPIQGKIAGPANEELSYKTFYDPASYSYSDGTYAVNTNKQTFWSKNQLGKLWWDLRTAKFYTPYFSNVLYKSNNWNKLAPGASIDIYEWVTSSLLPDVWDTQADTAAGTALGISGKSLYGNKAYSVRQRYNSVTKKFVNVYYFWVKNKRITPNVSSRKIAALSVSKLIASPLTEGYTYLSLLGTNSFNLNNAYEYMVNADVVLSIEYWTTDTIHRNIHSQWKLISTDTIVDLPHTIEQKWIDSLCGADAAGRVVPDPKLPPKLKYGVENRPRQGMFINRVEALKEFVEIANVSLLQHQIAKNYNISQLESYDKPPTKISGLYDSVLDTDAELVYANVNLFQRPLVAPIITNGKITAIKITNPGKGYLTAPYIQIVGSGEGAHVRAVIDTLGKIVSAEIINAGQGYNDDTVCIIRDYCVLLNSDTQANGSWSIYSYDPTYVNSVSKEITGIWSRILTQTFDVRNYWNFVDWYGSYTDATGKVSFTATQFTAADFSIQTYADLNLINVSVGQVVKVLTVNSGGWELLYKYADVISVDWTQSYSVVGIQNGTIQLSTNLYETSSTAIGYDASIYDNSSFDIKATGELRKILNALKNDIFINDLKQTYLNLFFSSVRYAHSEQLYLDWIFKTSFIRATHNVGSLGQPVFYPVDNLSNFKDYIAEVKPYKTKIREYISNYTSLDTSKSAVTDFDLSPIISKNVLAIIDTQVVNGKISANNSLIRSYPWKFWIDNAGYSITEIKIINGGSGYVTQPQVVFTSTSGSGATAQAFFTNGVINRLILLTPGSGYLSAPSIRIVGGLAENGTAAKAVAIIGDTKARTNLIGLKFDRLTYTNYIDSLDVNENFTGTGSRLQFPLAWAPDILIGKSSVYINNTVVLRELYTLHMISSVVDGYTHYSGTITFATAPDKSATITVKYKKDISLLNSADRIAFFYNPAAGELGKNLNQLMTGLDYGGTVVGNLGFNTNRGWNDVPYSTNAWDVFDPAFNDYIVTVASNSSYSFRLPYTPAVGTELNIYYQPLAVTSVPADGASLIYPFNLYIGLVTVSVTTLVHSVSADNLTATARGYDNVTNYSISTKLQSVLTAIAGAAGQSIILFSQVDNLVVGQFVSGRGVQLNSKIISISGNFVTLSTNLTQDVFGNYNFFTLGKTLVLNSTAGILVGMSIIGAGFTKQSVEKVVNATELILSAPPSLIPTTGELFHFTDNSAGSTILKVSSVANLRVGDVVTCNQTGLFGYNTKIVSIDSANSTVTLAQIIFENISNNIQLTFTRILSQAVDYISYANGTVLLSNPVPTGSTVNTYGKLDPIRIDAADFDTVANSSASNPYAVMAPIIIGTTQPPNLVTIPLVNNSNNYIINIPQVFTASAGDTFIIRQSTSDGSVTPFDYDSDITGGDLAYATARGIAADDIAIDGDGFVTTSTSPAPEEVVPGQVVDTVAIKVFDRPTAGNAEIHVDNYTTDGVTSSFKFKQIPSSARSIIVKLGNTVKTFSDDYAIDYANQTITFNTPPVTNQIATIFTVGYSGENILDIEYFVGNGSTKEFITSARWLVNVTALVHVNGVTSEFTLFKTDNTYTLSNVVGIRFSNAPASGDLINYIIVSGNDSSFSVTNTERIATDGNYTYALNNMVGKSLPNESSMIVRVDQTILPAPISMYFKVSANRLNYAIDTDRVASRSVNEAQILVLVENDILLNGRDYTVDLTGIVVKITRQTYKKYSGKDLIISVTANNGYVYDAINGKITFAYAYDNSRVVEVISSYQHDYLNIQRTAFTAQSLVNITPDLTVSYQYQNTIGGFISLDRTVLNENYVWVLKNSVLLTPGVDFVLADNRTSIQLTSDLVASDTVDLITFGSNILKSGIAYMQFKDMLNRKVYIRLGKNKQTTLAQDLHWNSTEIVLTDATNFTGSSAKQDRPGVIEIRGERIEYFSKIGNILRLLQRGTHGTGINNFNKAGTFVQDIGPSEIIPYKDSASTTTVISNGSDTVPLAFAPASANEIEVFVGGYDTTAVWSPNTIYEKDVIVNVGSYTYKAKIRHTSANAFSTDTDKWIFFVGNIRLKKETYSIFNVNKAPYGPAGDITMNPAQDGTGKPDFTVDGYSNQLKLSNVLSIGTRITVVKNSGIEWDSQMNILDDTGPIAQFIKAQPGIWYSEYK